MKGLASDFASLCCHGLFINSLLANLKCHEPDSKLLCKDGMAFLRFLRHVQFQQQRQRKLRTMAQSNNFYDNGMHLMDSGQNLLGKHGQRDTPQEERFSFLSSLFVLISWWL